jgi:hypothetical protein
MNLWLRYHGMISLDFAGNLSGPLTCVGRLLVKHVKDRDHPDHCVNPAGLNHHSADNSMAQSFNQSVLLPYTIQTWQGIVIQNGLPESRHIPGPMDRPIYPPLATIEDPEELVHLPKISSFADYASIQWPVSISNLVADCLRFKRSPPSF